MFMIVQESLPGETTVWFSAYNIPENEDFVEWAGVAALRLRGYHTPYLGPVFVKPDFRGFGLQRKFIEARIDYAKKNNISSLLTCTYNGNKIARRNVLACGFEELYRQGDEIWYELNV